MTSASLAPARRFAREDGPELGHLLSLQHPRLDGVHELAVVAGLLPGPTRVLGSSSWFPCSMPCSLR
ncbi:MAG TPA: hypothetical protein VK488_14050 [Gaiellaceae bacterium]|nr:hypothetical protein [Gaiellaceae bacterium]